MHTLSIKSGVEISQLHPRIVMALPLIMACFSLNNSDTIITSGRDGIHRDGSFHYTIPLRALDFRIWHVSDVTACAGMLRDVLGPDFDVVVERTHIHIELDPKIEPVVFADAA